MKKITRTISVYSGIEVKADFKTRSFTEKPFVCYDESEIPENAIDVKKENRLYVISVSDFMKLAKLAKEGETEE